MRECLFYVADITIEAVIKAYLRRDGVHHRLGTGQLDIDPDQDVQRAGLLKDPGLWKHGHEAVRGYRPQYKRAIIVLDSDFDGSPGAGTILDELSANLYRNGWSEDDCRVIVIDPEIENWIWIRANTHVERAFEYTPANHGGLRLHEQLEAHDWWQPDEAKPGRPKEAAEWVFDNLSANQVAPSDCYADIAARISIRGCTDEAFGQLQLLLQTWFPS